MFNVFQLKCSVITLRIVKLEGDTGCVGERNEKVTVKLQRNTRFSKLGTYLES
jgi:hypothetical protein